MGKRGVIIKLRRGLKKMEGEEEYNEFEDETFDDGLSIERVEWN
jgi:hypothetical protein